MPSAARFWTVIPAAGSGVRMGTSVPKQYLPLVGRTVIGQVLECLLAHARIAGVVVVIAAGDHYWPRYQPRYPAKPVRVTQGGRERAHSVLNGLHALQDELKADDWVLVHDAVRPCLYAEDLDKLILALEQDPVGGILAVPLTDTVKRVEEGHRIHDTPDRQKFWRAFTPQMFRYGVLQKALESVLAAGQVPTDEAAAVELQYPDQVRVVEGRGDNIKITRPADLVLAEAILAGRKANRA